MSWQHSCHDIYKISWWSDHSKWNYHASCFLLCSMKFQTISLTGASSTMFFFIRSKFMKIFTYHDLKNICVIATKFCSFPTALLCAQCHHNLMCISSYVKFIQKYMMIFVKQTLEYNPFCQGHCPCLNSPWERAWLRIWAKVSITIHSISPKSILR